MRNWLTHKALQRYTMLKCTFLTRLDSAQHVATLGNDLHVVHQGHRSTDVMKRLQDGSTHTMTSKY